MRTMQRLTLLCLLMPALAQAEECFVQGGNLAALDDAIAQRCAHIRITPDMNGMREFDLSFPVIETGYRYDFDWDVTFSADDEASRVTFRPAAGLENDFRFGRIDAAATFLGNNLKFELFGSEDNGGTFLVEDGRLELHFGKIALSHSGGFGGAIAAQGDSSVFLDRVRFNENHADLGGGHLAFHGASTGLLFGNKFYEGTVNFGFYGHALDVNTTGINEYGVAVKSLNNSFFSSQDINFGDFRASFLSLGDSINFDTDAFNAVAPVTFGGTLMARYRTGLSPLKRRPDEPGTQAACNDFGTDAFSSLGYNISPDDSCGLNQATDQPNTDALLALSEFGWLVPQAGSPAIDGGPEAVLIEPGNPLAIVPCATVDGRGTARPQDGDGDGDYECDLGAVEIQGPGSIIPAHSGAYYNSTRNGEGNYVEILSDDLAVIYTFTYKPDGSGPAWFVTLADIEDNALVALEMQRPIGASWGNAFDTADISRDPAGAMNLVFPTCTVANQVGNAAYTGLPDLGYEGLVSRTSRVSQIFGCGFTPSPNAGLSGSFYNQARDGEGLIIQWLANGQVLVIMFTYDPDGNQMWLTGTGTPNGKSVTIDVVYPAASTAWGRNFNPNEIDLQPWGSFTLTWTTCNALTFAWSSTVAGYGSGSLEYSRLTALVNTSCPTF